MFSLHHWLIHGVDYIDYLNECYHEGCKLYKSINEVRTVQCYKTFCDIINTLVKWSSWLWLAVIKAYRRHLWKGKQNKNSENKIVGNSNHV